MAHGNPILYTCDNCKTYIYNGRFSGYPDCSCGEKSRQTNQQELRDKYNLSLFYEFLLSFNVWIKIPLNNYTDGTSEEVS